MTSHMSLAMEPPRRILSLDGGGVRGLSSLLILENIMERIKDLEGLPEVPRPCERFDLIGGTGTGGIIAIMLGRLRMTVDQSIQEYATLTERAFIRQASSSTAVCTSQFENAIKTMIKKTCSESECRARRQTGNHGADQCQHENIRFHDSDCTKTAVLAMTKANVEALPTILTTYSTPTSLLECKVWEVARATSAHLSFFDSIKMGRDNEDFIDASYGYNNPCEILIKEAERQFPGKRIMTLSIGTGIGDVVEISDSRNSVVKALPKVAATSKPTHLRLRDKHIYTGGYFRFNVETGLKDASFPGHNKSGNISAHTRNYLHENEHSIKGFVDDFIDDRLPSLLPPGTSQGTKRRTEWRDNDYEDERDRQCLSDLHITDPRTDKMNIEEKKGGLLKDSYKWILDHADLRQFLTKMESRILWIRGDPGKGKTMLLCGLIDELELSSLAPISYFFCQATGGSRLNTATSVLRGLIYHLARFNPQLTKHVREKYDYKKDFLDTESAWHDLCEILTNMLNDSSIGSVILIVDALDECSSDLQRLLDFITKPSSAKWIVSSRNWPDIETWLGYGDQRSTIHLELNRDSVSEAVESYINFKVQKLADHKGYDQAMKDAVLKHLTTHADGTFLWVALVCQELSDMRTRKRHTPRTLKEFPPGLSPLYGRMLEHISRTSDGPIYKRVLATVLTVYRPLTLQQLQALVGELENYDEEDVEEIIASCGSFLTIHNSFVLFVHQSAKDYLLGEASAEILPSGIVDQHQTIFAQSLDLLCRTLKRDIYHLQAPGCLIDEVSVPDPDPLAPVQYSCLFWVDHFEDSAGCELNSGEDKMLSFFKKDYLHWLEALSLMKNIFAAARAVGKLQAYLQSKASKDLRDIIQDARLFLLSHAAIIETAPLQIYISALIFSPTNSLTRQNFSHEQPGWIDLSPRVGEGWNACQQILKGHDRSVESVVFSNDGQRLASKSFDNTVKIWNATSGVCLHTLESHCDLLGLVSIMFSNDGQRLALGCKDDTVKIWDVTSGGCLHTLAGHDNTVTSVVFSPDGHRLASGSHDRTAKIWDATSGACLHTLEGHWDWVTSVVFSNDGKRLATGSHDGTVGIWDATFGTCLHTLQGHDGWITSVAFTKDGHRLASGSMGKALRMCMDSASDAVKSEVDLANMQMQASGLHSNTVKIWDATSGVCLHTLKGHHSDVKLVVFSNAGQRLASVSFDGTVKIWDATSGACLHTLEGYKDVITSVVFSPDGDRLASASQDKTVKIWDATFGSCLQTLEGHHDQVTSVVFSNDGQRLASASSDKTVRIWDATLGTSLQTPDGHDETVTSVVFSNDGQRLASRSDHATVKIWDLTSGVHLHTLEGDEHHIESVLFSNDGQLLASGSKDKTVKIWDAMFGTCLHTLEGHDDSVTSVAFTNDGHRLASASRDNTVKVWDANYGVCLNTLEGHDEEITSVVFSNNGQQLASVSDDRTVKIWDANSGSCMHTLEGHNKTFKSPVFSNDAQRLASGSWDNTVKIWDVNSSACLNTLEGHKDTITSVVFSPDGHQLASGSRDNTVKIWDATSGACLHTFQGGNSMDGLVALSNDEHRLVSASRHQAVKIWDITSGACLWTLKYDSGYPSTVALSNDGHRLASKSSYKTVIILDATSGTCLQTLEGHDYAVASVVFSNDRQLLASVSCDNTVKIWDTTSGSCLQTLVGHKDAMASAVFSPDGHRLASVFYDKRVYIPNITVKIRDLTSGACLYTLDTLECHDVVSTSLVLSNDGQRLGSISQACKAKIWDLTTGECMHTLEGHDEMVTSVAFSNDSQRLALVSQNRKVTIRDVTSGACLHILEGHDEEITSAVFSNDGQRLASGSRDKTIKIWDVTSGKCLHTSPVGNTLYCPSTDVGLLDIQPQAAPTTPSIHESSLATSSFYSYSVCTDGTWVMKDGQRVLCLPPSHRPNMAVVFKGKKLVLAPPSRSVIIIGFR